jgi:hypothetical protein
VLPHRPDEHIWVSIRLYRPLGARLPNQPPNLRGLPMDKFIMRQNIAHYSNQLMTETDPVKRELLQKLLAEEMVKQASFPSAKA